MPLTPWQRLALGILAALLLTAIGTAGYMAIEGFSFFNALYQTATTITTAGFGEVEPMGDSGRAFTLFLIVIGIVIILYVLGTITQIAVEGELEALLGGRRVRARIRRMHGHHVVCGFGRVGEQIAAEFAQRGEPFIVIESNPEAIPRARRKRYLLVEGDATDDAILREAGVERARSLLAASDSDTGNAFTLLTARSMNPTLFLVGRAAHPETHAVMRRAGAERIISPYLIAAQQMAIAAIQPLVYEFLETAIKPQAPGAILAEIEITQESGLVGATIAEAVHNASSVVVLGLQKDSGELAVAPSADLTLNHRDRLIIMGDEQELESMKVQQRPQIVSTVAEAQ